MRFNGDAAVSAKGADVVSEEGFAPITGHDGLFIRQTEAGTEIAFSTITAGATVVTLQ